MVTGYNMSKQLHQIPTQHANKAVALQLQSDDLNSFWFLALAVYFAGVFYFYSYYFWSKMWGVLIGN
jgi:hypothetical protein